MKILKWGTPYKGQRVLFSDFPGERGDILVTSEPRYWKYRSPSYFEELSALEFLFLKTYYGVEENNV